SQQSADERALLAEEVSRLTGDAIEDVDAARLEARIQRATRMPRTNPSGWFVPAASLLEAVEREARARGYRRIALRALVTHAWCRLYEGRFLDSLADYDKAIAAYEQMRDADAATDTRMRRFSALRGLGQYEMAWREALGVIHDAHLLTQASSLETLRNEVCSAAQA